MGPISPDKEADVPATPGDKAGSGEPDNNVCDTVPAANRNAAANNMRRDMDASKCWKGMSECGRKSPI